MKRIYLSFNLVPRFVVWTEKQLRYDCLCRYTPIQETSIMGCHGNHAFKHRQNIFFLGNKYLGMPEVPMKKMIAMETIPRLAR